MNRHWLLDPEIAFLNHGSFGACPKSVLDVQQRFRERMERQLVQFYVRDLEALTDEARRVAAEFVGVEPVDLAFVPNATTAVNAVLRSLSFEPGDELLTTDHEYNACRNALEYVAKRQEAQVVTVRLPFPISSPQEVLARILDRVTDRTRLALIDHITSPTGLVLPIREIVQELEARGIETLVDGAHAPGMVDLDVRAIGAAYYTGNFHKWVCAPKSVGFLYVRRDCQRAIRPVVISHGANVVGSDRSRFLLEFDWTGTTDPTAMLSVPAAIELMGSLLPGGWPALRSANRALALAGRRLLCDALNQPVPAPEDMIGSLAAVPISDGSSDPPKSPLYVDPLQTILLERYGIEVPIVPFPAPPKRLVRISAQIYNHVEQYERLAEALRQLGIRP